MYNRTHFSAVSISTVAPSVGESKDRYSVLSSFVEEIGTGKITSKHEVHANFCENGSSCLFTGTAKECIDHIAELEAQAAPVVE